ncbi:hypothetical protein G6F40_013223 [Rhizopus arrhizus]|nr:hypothetical protein G6F40_013223 [Rhizopus arrhizus]
MAERPRPGASSSSGRSRRRRCDGRPCPARRDAAIGGAGPPSALEAPHDERGVPLLADGGDRSAGGLPGVHQPAPHRSAGGGHGRVTRCTGDHGAGGAKWTPCTSGCALYPVRWQLHIRLCVQRPEVSGRGGDRPSLHRRLRAVRRGQPRPCHLSRFQRQPHQRNAHWPPDHSDQWLAPAVPAAQARLPLCPLPGDRCVRQRSVRRTVASSGQAGSAVLPGRFATADV